MNKRRIPGTQMILRGRVNQTDAEVAQRPAQGPHRIRQDRRRAPNRATDKQIDQLVYRLCGLTVEEIRIVEGAEK